MKYFSLEILTKFDYYKNCISTLDREVLNVMKHKEEQLMLKPLGNRVIIEKVEQEQTTKSGIVLTDSAKEKSNEGKIIAVGAGRLLENGTRVAPEVKEGDNVVFQQYAGTEVKRGDDTYLILNEDDILAVIE
jgi:chaperonin GroES